MNSVPELHLPEDVNDEVAERERPWAGNDLHLALERLQLEELETSRLPDMESFLAQIQQRQEAENGLINLNRLMPFVNAMEALEELNITGLNAAPVWNSLRYMLDFVRQDPRAFDQLLEAYQLIGGAMPTPQQTKCFTVVTHDVERLILSLYAEILDFHGVAAAFFVQPAWKSLIRPLWKDLIPRLSAIEANMSKINVLLNNPTTAAAPDRRLSYVDGSTLEPPPVHVHHHHHHHQQYVAGNVYGSIEVSDQSSAHIGNSEMDNQKLDQLLHSLQQSRAALAEQEEARRDNQIGSVTRWLKASTAENFQRQAFDESRHPNTGIWILSQWKVADWMNVEFPRWPILWIQGIPGAGKTVLASVIIHSCKQVPDSDTIYFYSKHDDTDNTGTPLAVLKGLLRQLLHCRPWLAPFMDEQRRISGEQPELQTFSRTKKVLEPAIRGARRLYIVLDGLDECGKDDSGINGRGGLLTYLSTLVDDVERLYPGRLRLLVVSQNELDIRKALPTAEEVELQSKDTKHDIESFVVFKAGEIKRKFELEDKQIEEIVTRICAQAKGQFLYARLVVENLCAQLHEKAFHKEYRDFGIPDGLAAAYERIICRIRSQNTEEGWAYAKQLLGWMCRALRPLRRHELHGGMMINIEEDQIDAGLRLRVPLEQLCGVLISVVSGRMTLIHSTAKRYITESEYIDAFIVDCDMAALCLRYLSFDSFDLHVPCEEEKSGESKKIEQQPKSEEQIRTERKLERCVFRGDFAFADYAMVKWSQHLRQIVKDIDDLPQEMSADLLRLAEDVDSEEFSLAQRRLDKLQQVCEELEEFLILHDIQASQYSAAQLQNVSLSHNDTSLRILSELGAETNYRTILYHEDSHKHGDRNSRFMPSLKRLELSLTSWRQCLEKAGGKKGKKQDVELLKHLYGKRLFRCSRMTCHYFAEGYLTAVSRKNHLARHDRPYQCSVEECPSYAIGFTTEKQLERHNAVLHADDDSKRNQYDAFTKIEVTKAAEKKFPCSLCEKRFSRAAILRSHQLNHTGQKPYECSNCGRPFTRKNDCTRHEKTHNKSH